MKSGLVERRDACATPELLGAQRPRLSCIPAYSATSGPDALELAIRAGQPMDDWQGHVLTEALGERADGYWSSPEVCLIVPRQNGKGGVIETRIISGLALFDEALILYSSHEFKTSVETFRRVHERVESTPSLARRKSRTVRSTNELGIEFKGGQRVRFIARSGGSGRGFSGDCVILDEAYSLDDRHMDAMMPTLSARENSQLWYSSSAGMASSIQLGRVRRRGIANGPALAFFEWSIRAKRLGDATNDDGANRANWALANPGLGIRISIERVEREFRAMSYDGFMRERLGVGEYPSTDGGWEVISADAWTELADPASQLVDPVTFAVDTAPDHSWTSIGAAGLRLDGMVHVEVVDHRPGTDWLPARAAAIVGRWAPRAFLADESGPAASLIPALRRAGVTTQPVAAREVAAGCGHFLDLVHGSRLRHLGQPELNAAVKGARKREVGDKSWTWARRGVDVVISPLVAVTQAAYGFEVYGRSEQAFFGAWR